MAIKWTEDLAIAVVEIDDQHKELFKKMDELYSACKKGKGKAEIGNAIKFLADYVTTHFNTEEKFMLEHDYPDYSPHKAEHITFTKTVVELKRQFETEGPSLSIVIKTNLEIAEWLRKHIHKVDMNLGSFLKTRLSNKAIVRL